MPFEGSLLSAFPVLSAEMEDTYKRISSERRVKRSSHLG